MKKENIVFSLVNTEKYESFMRYIPHRDFEDLSIVYYEFEPNNLLYRLIGNKDLNNDNLTEEELYGLAMENTKRIMPPEIKKMSDVMREFEVEVVKEKEEDVSAYVISNMQMKRGASSILYGGIMDEVSKKLGGDFYLLPSSVHEFIAIPKPGNLSLDNLQEMVHYINLTQVEYGDRLSNQVYRYDSVARQVKQATFSPYTKLDEGRPSWSKWVTGEEHLPQTDIDESVQNDMGMQMGM